MSSAVRLRGGISLLSRNSPRHSLPSASLRILNSSLPRLRTPTKPCARLFSSSASLNGEYMVKVPQLAESIKEATIASLLKKVGESVETDEEIASLETDKIDVAVNAPEAGVIAEIFFSEGDTVVVEQDLARIRTGQDAQASTPMEKDEVKKADTPVVKEEQNQTDTTKKEKLEIDEDKTADASQPEPSASQTNPAPKKKSASKPAATGTEAAFEAASRTKRSVKMTRMRKTIATRLKQSQDTCASLTTIQEVDMSNLIAWRIKYREEVLEEHGMKLGYMGAFTKATTMAAQQVPQVNASIDTDEGIITYRDYVDVSIAVSAPKGLITPVIRNTHEMSIVELEREVAKVAKKARDGKLTMGDLEGGNFSISNPGIFGSMFGTPVINYPQASVFNMNGIQQRVVAVNGEAVIRPIMHISLTYDHRLIEGRDAVRFLNLVKRYIEDPSRMLLV